jgi:hypothetical protein
MVGGVGVAPPLRPGGVPTPPPPYRSMKPFLRRRPSRIPSVSHATGGGEGPPPTKAGVGRGTPLPIKPGGWCSPPSRVRRGTHPPFGTGPGPGLTDGAVRILLSRAPARWGVGTPLAEGRGVGGIPPAEGGVGTPPWCWGLAGCRGVAVPGVWEGPTGVLYREMISRL